MAHNLFIFARPFWLCCGWIASFPKQEAGLRRGYSDDDDNKIDNIHPSRSSVAVKLDIQNHFV